MVLPTHLLLACCWILFCLLHSLLAATRVKKIIIPRLKKAGPYYRLFYTVFAAGSFGVVIALQLSLTSPLLVQPGLSMFIAGIAGLLTGLIIMGICIRRYFFRLSGLRGLLQQDNSQVLLQNGLHKYVRHPLYLGTFLFIWSLFLLFPSLSAAIANGIITLYTIAGARLEEQKLVEMFGPVYTNYRQKVPMFIPLPWKNHAGGN